MKSILIAALCAVTLTAQAEEAKRDTIHKYTIDKQPVEHFDGSQLEGKHIAKYIIAYKEGKGVVEKHHVIYTGVEDVKVIKIAKDGNASGSMLRGRASTETLRVASNKGQLIVVDGKEVTEEEMLKIKSEDVAGVNILAPGSKAAEAYGEKGHSGVILIETKTAKNLSVATNPLVVVDGKEASYEELGKIVSEKIDNVTVLKSGSEAANSYGEKGKNGVILVTTKAAQKKK